MTASTPTRPARPRLSRQWLALAFALSAPLAWAQANPPAERAGTVKLVQGDVRLGQASSGAMAQPGDAIRVGDRVLTGRDGAASLLLRDGTVMTLGPNSSADLSQFKFDSTTQEGNLLIDLLQGSVRLVTGLLSKLHPEQVKVKTPTAVVGVRGTVFIVEAIRE